MNAKPLIFLAALLVSIPVGAASSAAQEKEPAPKPEAKSDAKDILIPGVLLPNDVPDKLRRHPCKIHTLRLEKGATYVIDLESRGFDTYLRIEDAKGQNLAQDDDGGEGLNSRLRFQPKSDDNYRIIVTSFGGGAGMYTLKVRREDAAAKPAAGQPAALGAPIQGKLTMDDPADAVRKHPSKVHTVKLTQGKTYVIDLESTDFDAYLRLEDPAGKHVAQDDDGGGFPHARIRHVATQSGEHRIIATSFGGGTGGYTLTVRELK